MSKREKQWCVWTDDEGWGGTDHIPADIKERIGAAHAELRAKVATALNHADGWKEQL